MSYRLVYGITYMKKHKQNKRQSKYMIRDVLRDEAMFQLKRTLWDWLTDELAFILWDQYFYDLEYNLKVFDDLWTLVSIIIDTRDSLEHQLRYNLELQLLRSFMDLYENS